MLRTLLLYLSTAGWARSLMMRLGFARRTARRFVAGEHLDEALAVAKALNQKGMMVSLDLLGENVYNETDAQRAVGEYRELLDAIAANQIEATVSIKLTQLGLDIGEDFCETNMRTLLTHAKAKGLFINIDMEGSVYTDSTLQIFRRLNQDFDNVGTVIQAYLYRSESDMHQLGAEGANVRLCKGAYKEPAEIAFPHKADVDANYLKLMKLYLDEKNRAQGAYLKVATHDPAMIEATKAFVKANEISLDSFEFQMLYGIRRELQETLVQEGYRLRVYVPYGTQWYPYFMRRLAERPANVWFLLKSIFAR